MGDDQVLRQTDAILKDGAPSKGQPKLLPKQSHVMREFDRAKRLAGVRPWTRYSYAVWMRDFAQVTRKPFERVSKRDAEDFLLSKQKLSPVNQFRHRVYLKFFLTWLYGEHLHQEVPDWVKKIPRNKPAFKRSPQELLTREEIQRLITAAEDPRHQLLVRLLAESGLRRGEIIGLTVGDIAFEGQLTKLWADGKSGQGEVYLYEVTPYLMSYLRIHPGRKNPDAPLFYEFGAGGQLKPWGLTTPYAIVRRLADKAGLLELDATGGRKSGKRVFLHLFRATAATEDAQKLPDALLRLKYRWSAYSQMPQHYASLSGTALKEAVMRVHGLAPKKQELPQRIECPVCHFINEGGERFCSNCYRGITLEAALETEEKRRLMEALMDVALRKRGRATLDALAEEVRFAKEQKRVLATARG